MNGKEPTTIEEKISANAELATIIMAEDYGVKLGFDKSSVALVDDFIERSRKNLP